MFVRCWVIYLLFLHLIDKVSLQFVGVVGGSVILPCSYQERELKPEEMNVFWRYSQSKVVFNIEKGSPSIKKQDAMFKDRIESFPSEYMEGNFSIRLLNLMPTDAGQFLCGIADELKEYRLTLQVKEPPTTPPTTVSTPSDKRNSSVKTQPEGIVTFLIAVLEFLLLHYIRD